MVDKKWKMFERLVAAIHIAEQRGATVKWNEEINGRQFDVTIRFRQGLYEYLTVIECKDYTYSVPAEKVDALVTKSRDVGANKAIMVAASGFQEGAREAAKRHGIQLMTLKVLSETSEGEITDELSPIVVVYNFRFKLENEPSVLAIPEETGILRLFLRTLVIEGPGFSKTPEEIIKEFRLLRAHTATPLPQLLKIPFPKGTILIHPNTQARIPVTSFSFEYLLVSESQLKTKEGLGIDLYLSGSVYKLQDEMTKEDLTIDSSTLELGFDTVLTPGKYYSNPHLGFSYYCLEVTEDKAKVALIESYQAGRLIQALFVIDKDQWSQFVEVRDKKELERLAKLYIDYKNLPGNE